MSDENDKLVRQSHEIEPAQDFARKIEERLRAEPVPKVEPERECGCAFKFENGVITRCVRIGPHVEHQNGMVFWKDGCNAVSPDGEPCIYQLQHEGDHGNGRDATWEQQAIAQIGTPGAFEVLGDLLQKSPAFQQMLAKRVSAQRAMLQKQPLRPTRDWQVPFGPEVIQPQSSVTIVQQLQMYFRGDKLVNTGDVDGLYIENIFVGARQQMPGGQPGIGVRAFEPASLSSGIRFDTVQPGFNISMVVRNVSNEVRTFAATMFGKAVV